MVFEAGVCRIDIVMDMLCIVIVFSLNLELSQVKLNWNIVVKKYLHLRGSIWW